MFNKKVFIILVIFLNIFFVNNVSAVEFKLTDVNGKVHTQKDYEGKFLIVNYWATWCPPCLVEIPAFVKFKEKYKDKVEILGLNYQEISSKRLEDFIDSHFINYPIFPFNLVGNDFTQFDNVRAMPTTLVYDEKGKLIDKFLGEMNIEDLEKAIKPKKSFFGSLFLD
jgi:thiol-disulfide isomerase/thioredoxin